jgi:hypothetical protein
MRKDTDIWNNSLAARLPIPVVTSASIQIPSILAFLPPQKGIRAITYHSSQLDPLNFNQLRFSMKRIHTLGEMTVS